MNRIRVNGIFDDLRSAHVRLLEETAGLGEVEVELWTDELVRANRIPTPKYPFEERLYLLQAIRYVRRVRPCERPADDSAGLAMSPFLGLDEGTESGLGTPGGPIVRWDPGAIPADVDIRRAFSGSKLRTIPSPAALSIDTAPVRKRVVVTGCFDWFHSGHVRFFEEASSYGDLYVGVGSDANVRALKGEGHPLFPQDERAYMVQAVRCVERAFVSSGSGWLDAEPEMALIRPHAYVVNEDGDRPEKRDFCRSAGIEYIVLRRIPKAGLPRRDSTGLRGF